MKYFTPDLLERFRSKDGHVAAVASDEWEQRAEAYADYLRSVRSQFPRSLRQLLDNYYLHDAWVVFAAALGQVFGIYLKLDTPRGNHWHFNTSLSPSRWFGRMGAFARTGKSAWTCFCGVAL